MIYLFRMIAPQDTLRIVFNVFFYLCFLTNCAQHGSSTVSTLSSSYFMINLKYDMKSSHTAHTVVLNRSPYCSWK